MLINVPPTINALLLGLSLVVGPTSFAQEDPAVRQQTRPRRVTGVSPQVTDAADVTPSPSPLPEVNTTGAMSEPWLRIGLITDARSVNISTNAVLLQTTEINVAPQPLEVAQVRIEAHTYPPLTTPPNENREPQITPARREQVANQTDQTGQMEKTNSRASSPANKVQLTAAVRVPLRGTAVYASGAAPLFHARAPVTFSSSDELQAPLKLSEKTYRGRLEVFANARGSLTVVNVVKLEDYVRGVVPNELSPGSFPALEALKAQAVAARTYAISHRGQFASEGFDLLPTTRSQVYGGRGTEHPLTDRAVAETHGHIATYKGETINALYTSTCGGRTEHAENIFGGEPVPYLRSRECAFETHAAFAPLVIRSSRALAHLREAENLSSARDLVLLWLHNFPLSASRGTDEWLSSALTLEDVRALLNGVAALARQVAPVVSVEATRPPGFSAALAGAIDGESRGDVLLNQNDVDYHLSFPDAPDIPARYRADVAMLLREGHLTLHADATLRPRQSLTRARAIRTVAHLLRARHLLRLEKAITRPAENNSLVLRPVNGKGPERTVVVSRDAYLFRAFGETLFPVREVTLVGGEAVAYHMNASGAIDYLEVQPAANGATPERFSPFSNWTVTLTTDEVASRLTRWSSNIGALVDLRVLARGASRRVLDLEVVGVEGTAHIRDGRIRSALGLREQLFVIERRYDEQGRIAYFIFTGRGWGHGVGLCQVGAYGLARAGWSYDKILKAYYSGIDVTKRY